MTTATIDRALTNIKHQNDDGQLFLRSNTEFAEDMRQYRESGQLQNLSPGHGK